MKAATRSVINSEVRRLLAECGITQPPINLEQIARRLKVPIRSQPLPNGVSGFLYRQGDVALIVVNSTHRKQRQRFTIAHEIGHLVLSHKRDQIHVDKDYAIILDRGADSRQSAQIHLRSTAAKEGLEEVQANGFAAALLMPEPMIRADINKYTNDSVMDDGTLIALAQRYGVSMQALLIRLNTMNLTLKLQV